MPLMSLWWSLSRKKLTDNYSVLREFYVGTKKVKLIG